MKARPGNLGETSSTKGIMKNAFRIMALTLSLAALTAGCTTDRSQKEQRVSAEQMSPAARTSLEKVTAGGQVDEITKEIERGQTVYDVEATVGGRHLEFLISDRDGTVLGTEVPMEFSALPEAVRTASEQYFGTASGLKAMKGVEFGETSYEIEGPKGGKTVEVTFNPEGKLSK
jgi:hypothetical protein